jgi:lipoprotein-anchoring transpeptidase ErfK/SrfK
MLSEDGIIIAIQVVLIIFVSSILFYVVDNKGVLGLQRIQGGQENNQLYIPIYEEEVLAVEQIREEKYYATLDICHTDSCYTITPEEVETFYINNELKQSKVYMYILEYVIPYFEKLSGGKILVENSKGAFNTWKEDGIIDTRNIYEDVVDKLEVQGDLDAKIRLELELRDLPGTDGKYADKYIEIDNSKQKLYDWEDGEVVKEIKLSAAKYGWQVYGVFPIVDKGIEPRAPSGNYMPYWMAFYYSPRQDSWYGLHGLVWWYDEKGNRVHENTEYIGERRSAGCIRMLKDDAKYLYDRYEKGDHILIHE